MARSNDKLKVTYTTQVEIHKGEVDTDNLTADDIEVVIKKVLSDGNSMGAINGMVEAIRHQFLGALTDLAAGQRKLNDTVKLLNLLKDKASTKPSKAKQAQ